MRFLNVSVWPSLGVVRYLWRAEKNRGGRRLEIAAPHAYLPHHRRGVNHFLNWPIRLWKCNCIWRVQNWCEIGRFCLRTDTLRWRPRYYFHINYLLTILYLLMNSCLSVSRSIKLMPKLSFLQSYTEHKQKWRQNDTWYCEQLLYPKWKYSCPSLWKSSAFLRNPNFFTFYKTVFCNQHSAGQVRLYMMILIRTWSWVKNYL